MELNLKSLTVAVIGTAIMLVLASSVLIPVINSSTSHTEQNEGYHFTLTDAIGDYEYTVDASNDLLINGELLELGENLPSTYYAGIQSATIGMSHKNASAKLWVTSAEIGTTTSATEVVVSADGTWAQGTNTGTFDTTKKAFFACNGGEYGAYANSTGTFTVTNGVPIYFGCQYGQCVINSTTYGLSYQGQVIDGVATLNYAHIYKDGAAADVTESATYAFSYASKVEEAGATTYTNAVVSFQIPGYTLQAQSYFIVPIEYSVHNEGAVYSLVGIIPLLVFVGIVLGVVGMFVRRD